jgi:hypothetical protein
LQAWYVFMQGNVSCSNKQKKMSRFYDFESLDNFLYK